MTHAAQYWPKDSSLFMLVQLASTINSSQHQPMSRTLTQWVTDDIEQSHCHSSTGSSNERRNMPPLRPSPKSSVSQLLSSQRSAWACSGRLLASYKPTQPGHPSVVFRQSACRWPCHKPSGRLPLHSTRLVVTFPLTEHHHTLPCWVTESRKANNVPNVRDVTKFEFKIRQRSNLERFQQIRNLTNVLSALSSNVNSWKTHSGALFSSKVDLF